jgi:hypothetical protein
MAWDMEKMAALFGKTATWRGAGQGGEAAIIADGGRGMGRGKEKEKSCVQCCFTVGEEVGK